MRKTANFTKHELETTTRVMMESRVVTSWVKSQAKFLGVDLNTPRGQDFYERETRAYAAKLMR